MKSSKPKTLPVPRDLNEAIDQILSTMSDAEKRDFKREPEDFPGVRFHFGGGMAMRNDWGLWYDETGIAKFLQSHRIVHGDDKSCTIFRALWRRLHGLPIDAAWLAEQAAYYERYWNKVGVTWDQKELPGWKPKARTNSVFRVGKDGSVTDVTDES